MENDKVILEALKGYLHRKYKIDPLSIKMETSLLYDLHIKADDVDEFFSALIKDFKIELKSLDLSRFFIGDEPFDFISPVIRFFKRVDIEKKPTITIGDIEKFIQTGILN